MNEKILLRYAIISTVVGLLSLYLIAEEVSLGSMEKYDSVSGQEMKMEGIVKTVRPTEKAVFLTVEGVRQETIEAIAFTAEPLYVHEGDRVQITGVIEEYQGKREVIVETLELR